MDEQLALLRQRNRIFELADVAIADGDRKAYDELLELAGKAPAFWETANDEALTKAAISQLRRVEINYYFGDAPAGKNMYLDRAQNAFVVLPDEPLGAAELLSCVTDNPFWGMRLTCARQLKRSEGRDAAEALLKCAETDDRLEVFKACMFSFRAVTGFKDGGILFTRQARWWWTENSDRLRCERGWTNGCDKDDADQDSVSSENSLFE